MRTLTLAEAAREFLSQKRIVVVGVSRNPSDFSGAICRKLRAAGREVVPVNPAASSIDGAPCYPDLRSVPGTIDAVLVLTPAAGAEAIVRSCLELGITRVWLHRSLGPGSASAEAVELGRTPGMMLIRAGCPMMFCEPVDIAHRCFRWCLGVTGRLPREVAVAE